jgi:hypothetical protein
MTVCMHTILLYFVRRGHCRIIATPNPIYLIGKSNMFKPKQRLFGTHFMVARKVSTINQKHYLCFNWIPTVSVPTVTFQMLIKNQQHFCLSKSFWVVDIRTIHSYGWVPCTNKPSLSTHKGKMESFLKVLILLFLLLITI